MDPLSITATALSLAALCGKVSVAVYSFIDDAAGVDDHIADLKRELDGLTRILNLVSRPQAAPNTNAAGPSGEIQKVDVKHGFDKGVVEALSLSMADCRVTLEKLEAVFARVGSTRGLLRWAGRAGRQIRLSLKSKEIDEYRRQIVAHSQDMQLTMAIMSVGLLVGNNDTSGEILHALRNLEVQISATGRKVTQVPEHSSSPSSPSIGLLQAHRQSLIDTAASFHTNVSVRVAQSARSATEYNPSINGEQLEEGKWNAIKDWVPQPGIHEEPHSPQTTDEAEKPDPNAASEDELDSELLASLKTLALQNFNEHNYETAEVYLRQLRDDLVKPTSRPVTAAARALYTEMSTMLILSQAALGKSDAMGWIEHFSVEPEFVGEDRTSDMERLYYDALHVVARACVQEDSSMAEAEDLCRRSLKGKQSMVGKSGDWYFSSLLLLSEIYRQRGNRALADASLQLVSTETRANPGFLHHQSYAQWILDRRPPPPIPLDPPSKVGREGALVAATASPKLWRRCVLVVIYMSPERISVAYTFSDGPGKATEAEVMQQWPGSRQSFYGITPDALVKDTTILRWGVRARQPRQDDPPGATVEALHWERIEAMDEALSKTPSDQALLARKSRLIRLHKGFYATLMGHISDVLTRQFPSQHGVPVTYLQPPISFVPIILSSWRYYYHAELGHLPDLLDAAFQAPYWRTPGHGPLIIREAQALAEWTFAAYPLPVIPGERLILFPVLTKHSVVFHSIVESVRPLRVRLIDFKRNISPSTSDASGEDPFIALQPLEKLRRWLRPLPDDALEPFWLNSVGRFLKGESPSEGPVRLPSSTKTSSNDAILLAEDPELTEAHVFRCFQAFCDAAANLIAPTLLKRYPEKATIILTDTRFRETMPAEYLMPGVKKSMPVRWSLVSPDWPVLCVPSEATRAEDKALALANARAREVRELGEMI